jgi:hypothetical protein
MSAHRRTPEEGRAHWAKRKDRANAARRAEYAANPQRKLKDMTRTNRSRNRRDQRRLDARTQTEA